ncbi:MULTISPECIES: UvrD-helicase domain-containing protein [unclassified Streptomyces]|uniref:UvrD-helicase domain-containing protein n=1 Tax=unclassified Streptomyces TaxID=2593676 RepID=UPI0019071C9A|nr:UvrD-helicase domain-containing protein [Streptomyces sp. HSG2]
MSARITDPEQLKELLGIPFTPEQMACVTAPPAPQVIVAGAGSGKTTVMAARVVWLVGTGLVAPEQVLGLTFTNKAAGELAERVRVALSRAGVTGPVRDAVVPEAADPGEPVISTYHAFAGRLLADHGLRVGLEPTTRLLADATRHQLAARVLREAPGPYPALTHSFGDLVADMPALDAELSEHLVEPEELLAWDAHLSRVLDGARLTNDDLRGVPQAVAVRRELTDLVIRYRAAKHARDLLDFGDQIALAARLARLPEVGEILRAEFRVVLLDEYQDTSVAQRVFLADLFGRATGHPVTAVGDPCQAIYGWRGASVANLDDFPEHFTHPDGRPAARYALSENRRSGGRLLELANGLAAPLRAMHAGVEALRPASGVERDGAVRCALLPTHAEEIAWVARSVADLVDTGRSPGGIAVLCRTATDFADLRAALVAREVPVEVVGLSGLLHLPEVADLVAVCEVLQDPGANASLVRLLTGPRWRVGPRDLALLGRRARSLVAHADTESADPDRRLVAAVAGADPAEVVSLADALDTFLDTPMDADREDDGLPFSSEARVRFARLAAELRELRRSLSDPLMDVLHRILTVTGLEVELSASPDALAARRRETLANFLDVAASFAASDGEATVGAFIGFLRTAARYEKGLDNDLPGGEDTVKILTVHRAKGLEWDVVVVPGLVAGAFPGERGREKWTARGRVLPHALRGDRDTLPEVESWDARGMKSFHQRMRDHQHVEELRLGYVAFTRARSLLLGSGHWWGPAQKRTRGPSEFLTALHDHCVAGHGEIEQWAEAPPPGAGNPALSKADSGPAWPLPPDASAQARRRSAAELVLAHLRGRVPAAPAGPAGGPAPDAPRHPGMSPVGGGTAGVAVPHQAPARDDDGREGDVPADARSRPDDPAEEPPSPANPEPRRAGSPRIPSSVGLAEAGTDRLGALAPEEARTVASWDRDLDILTRELLRSRDTVTEVPLPTSLSASQLLRLAADPDGLAQELARPMPRPPQPAARRGTRFHAWVEARFEALRLPVADPEEPPRDAEIADEPDLEGLKEAFGRTEYARRTPYRVEAPFQLALAGRIVRGRVDAVYRRGEGASATYEIVDWKTHRAPTADPLQLAVYRLGWAEQQGVPVESVSAAFLYVRTGEVVRPADLPGRAELERLLLGEPLGDEPHDREVGRDR